MIKSRYFYRNFITQNLQEISDNSCVRPENFIFIETSVLNDTKKTFCPICNKTQQITTIKDKTAALDCSHSVNGYFAEYPVYFKKQTTKTDFPYNRSNILYSDKINNITASEFKDYLTGTIKARKYCMEETFSMNEDCTPKNQFLFEIKIDEKDFKMEIIWHAKTDPLIDSKSVCFDLINGEISGDTKNTGNIPLQIFETALEEYKNLISKWCGFPITIQNHTVNYNFLVNLTKFPFCPSINSIINSTVILKFKGKCKRTNPECYKELCKSLKLDDCKTARRLFSEKPETLLVFKILKTAGFKDINIISQFLSSNLASLIKNNNFESFIFYIKKALKYHNEKKLFNLMLSNIKTDVYNLIDGINMFREYYRYTDRTLRKCIFKYGFTQLNHNTLAEISYRTYSNDKIKKNIRFKYTEAEKSLEDKIGNFEFKLPRDSHTLTKIGMNLHNCVASYTEQILNKNCTVVYATINNNYEICIEIRENEIFQQRGKYNNDLEGEAAKAMEKYQQRHNLIFEKNYF